MGASQQLRSMIVFALVSLGMLIVASLPLFASPLFVPSNTIVVSQIYGAGGNGGATYQNDFVELFNRGSTTINVTGWTVQYAPATSSSWVSTTLSGSIAPGQYFLIKQGSGGTNGVALPTADVTGTINMSASAGKIALVNRAVTLSGTCPLTSTNLIDLIGYGSSANCFEGAAPAPVSSNNANSTQRLAYGCTETDSNTGDFSTGTVRPRNTAYPKFSCALTAEKLLITEALYDGTQTDEGDEFIEITNPLTYTVTLTGYKIGDEETKGGGEGMYEFPAGSTIVPNAVILIARNAAQFHARFGFDPQYELATTGVLTDTPSVPNLDKYTAWATGSLALANDGDEVLLLGPGDQIVDSVAWGHGNFTAVGLRGDASASEPLSLQRYGTHDSNNMSLDFLRDTPHPGTLVMPPAPPTPIPGTAMPNGMFAYWGDIHSHSAASDGSGPPRMAFDTARANGLHFFALTDHDAWLDTEEWNEIGNDARDTTTDGAFIGLRGFEWTHSTKGHINVYNSATWVSRDDPNYDTLAEFYAWLAAQPNVVAQFNHPDPSYGGTFDNFAYNAAAADKIALLEIGNNGSVPYKRFEAQYPQALNKNWRVAPEIGSDHHGLVWGNDSTHRTGIIAPSLTMTNVLDALRARRVFATEDANLVLALQSNGAWMGATITAQVVLTFTITARDPNPEPITLEVYDNGTRVAAQVFPSSNVTWTVAVPGSSLHSYYVRATQSDGDIAYTAPIWTDNTPLPTPIPPTPLPRESTWDLGHVSIETARTTQLHKRVLLEGCVTVPPGVLSDSMMFLQDTTGGIKIYLSSERGDFPPINLWDRVALRGVVAEYYSEREIEIEEVKLIEPRGSCGTIALKQLATGAVDKMEGWLVEVRGRVASVRTNELQVNDDTGMAWIQIDPTTKIRLATQWRGQNVRVIGVVSRWYDKAVIMPRYNSDIELLTLSTPTRTPASARTTATRPLTLMRTPTPQPAATRRNTPTVSPTPRATRTPTPLPRAQLFPLNEDLTHVLDKIPLNAETAAVVGGSTSVATGFACFVLALALARRR